jgi:hypothetical protein
MNQSTSGCALIAIVAIGSGCTQWATTPMYGPRTEVARRLVGSPQVEQVTSSNVSAGFAAGGSSYNNGAGYGTGYAIGGLSGSHDSVTRTHCVQQAQVDYAQPVDYVSHVERRPLDVAGSITLGVVGLAVIGGASANYNDDLSFYNMDPSFFSKPDQPTAAYAIGGAAIVGAAAWLIYSLTSLPKGAPPQTATQQRTWTETTYVEAQGCGLVPADRPDAAPVMP